METGRFNNNTRSNTRPLLPVLLVLLVAAAIAHALGVPVPVLSTVLERNKGSRISEGSRPEFASEKWYRGASEYVKAEADQRQLGAPLIVYFYTDWCSYCKKFDRDILTSPEVNQFMSSVVKVRVNPEAGQDEAALASQYGVTGYPSIFVVDAQTGRPRKVYPFKRVGGTFVPVEPTEFVAACR